MAELDGVWNVKRLGGLLPPLVGVRKRIRGGSGETTVGPLPGAPFDVVGFSLRYRAPFTGFVDELERHGDGFRGRATFHGLAFGRFALERVSTEEGQMASQQLKDQRIAERAGDNETAGAMAKKIEGNWDKFAELSLQEEGSRPSFEAAASESRHGRASDA